MYKILLIFFSWDNTTFSLPLIIKYPPWSYGHSPNSDNLTESKLFNKHSFEWIMIGMKPILTFSKFLTINLSESNIIYFIPILQNILDL